MVRRILLAGLIAGFVAGSVGCRHCCKRLGRDRDVIPPPPRDGFLAPPAPPSGGAYIPSPGVPSSPAPTAPPAPDRIPPPSLPDRTGNFRPGTQELFPDPLPPGTSSKRDSGRLLLPPGDPNETKPTTPTGPVPGVDGFTIVADGLANGKKPALDGFDSLVSRGYRTAVYLHAPSADVSPVQELAGRKGLRFTAVPASPETVKESFSRFVEAVRDKPAAVLSDADDRAGAMWYLYFRTVLGLNDDAARIRATPLGLPDASETKWWLAIQDYLATR